MHTPEHNIEVMKSQARWRLAKKYHEWNKDREDRDSTRGFSRRAELKDDRKANAERIARILNDTPAKSFDRLERLLNFQRNNFFRDDLFPALMTKQFGFDVNESMRTNHKGTWVPPVWEKERWFRDSIYAVVHQVHQSEDDPTQVAYNRNLDNIQRNIQTRTKPGKYLTQFFGDVLSQDQIREWAEKQIAHASCKAELKFIENNDEDGWVRVYEDGPGSCMRGNDAVKVYAYEGNGLRLAYLDSGGQIVARSIVVNSDDPEEQGWIRIYATEQRWMTDLRVKLEEAGYPNQTSLNGIKLQKISADHDGRDGYVCPYIDVGSGCEQSVSVCDGYLLVDDDGDISATNTSGTIPAYDGRECDECGDHEDEDDMTYVESTDQTVCQHCLDNRFTYAYGRRHQDYFPEGDCIYCESDSEWYHQDYANYHDVYQCRISGDWYHLDDLVNCDAGNYEGDYIHVDEAVQESKTDNWMYIGDCTEINGEWVADEFVTDCHITGNPIDMRESVAIEIGQKRSYYGTPFAKLIYVSADAWDSDLIRENFVMCGDLLLPRGYYGNEINDVTEPSNIEYGDEFDGDRFEDLFVEEAEHLLAA
jgi:hypothetical protein